MADLIEVVRMVSVAQQICVVEEKDCSSLSPQSSSMVYRHPAPLEEEESGFGPMSARVMRLFVLEPCNHESNRQRHTAYPCPGLIVGRAEAHAEQLASLIGVAYLVPTPIEEPGLASPPKNSFAVLLVHPHPC